MTEPSTTSTRTTRGEVPVDAAPAAAGAAATAPPGPPLLEVRGLVKQYPGTRALDGVHLEVRAGEVHALLGENGAGKSTLIKCLAGVVHPDAGEILMDGRVVEIPDARTASNLGITVIHQHSNLVPDLTVAENLFLGERFPRRAGILLDRRRMLADARPLLQTVGLPDVANKVVAELRPHEAAMVSVARAIRAQARLIIMDEPTTALTYEEVQTLFGQIRRLAGQGVGFIYVSHRLVEVFDIADRLTVLRNGRRTGSWDQDAANEKAVVDAIIGDERELIEHRGDEANERGPVELAVRGLRVGGAVLGVDFEVHGGEVLGFAGLAGSGAEEAVGALYGFPVASAGEIVLDGHAIRPRHPADAKAAGIAFVPKDRHAQAILPGFSIRENISVASTRMYRTDAVIRWLRRGPEREAAQRVFNDLHIKAPSTATEIDALSGGNQQKCVIGRWFTRDYRLYLFVDPCAGVDIHSKSEIYDLIRQAAARGAAVIFTSTEVEEFPRVCDRVLVFREGRVVGEMHGADVDENTIVRLSLSGQGAAAATPGASA